MMMRQEKVNMMQLASKDLTLPTLNFMGAAIRLENTSAIAAIVKFVYTAVPKTGREKLRP